MTAYHLPCDYCGSILVRSGAEPVCPTRAERTAWWDKWLATCKAAERRHKPVCEAGPSLMHDALPQPNYDH